MSLCLYGNVFIPSLRVCLLASKQDVDEITFISDEVMIFRFYSSHFMSKNFFIK